ncbi:hypothetical protein Tco_0832694 [Tanacetum coccineum]
MLPATAPLIGFNGEIIWLMGQIMVRSKKNSSSPSTAHEMLKFPIQGGILTLRSSKIIPLECKMVLRPEAQPSASTQVAEEKIIVAIHPEYLEQTIAIGSTLTKEGRKELCDLLRRNLDIFAWKPSDMTRVPWHIAEHRLNIHEGCTPIRQKKRSQKDQEQKKTRQIQDRREDL